MVVSSVVRTRTFEVDGRRTGGRSAPSLGITTLWRKLRVIAVPQKEHKEVHRDRAKASSLRSLSGTRLRADDCLASLSFFDYRTQNIMLRELRLQKSTGADHQCHGRHRQATFYSSTKLLLGPLAGPPKRRSPYNRDGQRLSHSSRRLSSPPAWGRQNPLSAGLDPPQSTGAPCRVKRMVDFD